MPIRGTGTQPGALGGAILLLVAAVTFVIPLSRHVVDFGPPLYFGLPGALFVVVWWATPRQHHQHAV
jgi:hypothetical protein